MRETETAGFQISRETGQRLARPSSHREVRGTGPEEDDDIEISFRRRRGQVRLTAKGRVPLKRFRAFAGRLPAEFKYH
jgi:hypothetical protein